MGGCNSMSASAGRVLIIPKGTYDASATYHMLDLVVYDGSSYIAKQTTTGNLPTNTTYWQLLANGNAVAHLYDIGDVTITNPSTGQILKWNGTAWINAEDKGGLKPHLVILSDHGSTVTVVKGGTTYTATETSSGTYETDVDEFGTYTIHALMEGDDAQLQLVVDTCKVYTVHDEHFHASITVTYPSGYSCMISGGSETYVATSSPYEFVVHSANTFVITTEDANQNTYTDTVIVTESGQSFSKRCPNGSQLPANDISNWLFSGARSENYTQLSEVLADSTCLAALIASQNAMDYLVRSTTWASDITSDSTAMSLIGLNNYASDTLLSDSTWRSAICNSTYVESVLNVKVPTMTSNTTPEGTVFADNADPSNPAWYAFDGNDTTQWTNNGSGLPSAIGYQFTSAQIIQAILIRPSGSTKSRVKDFTLQASNDGINWADLYTGLVGEAVGAKNVFSIANSTAYDRYRIRITSTYETSVGAYANVFTLQFYGRVDV